ncbi:hypothetical protein GCM10009785_14340 [Brooklawnia cerclae]|uniref:Alpha-D-ribose 1-methylphosphonate 5-triphosphate synthase subunit PhnG n=1 Tax=Brooklawnia cerclae TaxID=349934 RepID=A0ABX0SMK5_9ACTN|nr:alpha-D-ribose 1-methylphosphonate 5-triphosphate synthase subunit PhnG [Brooklawnia cerclae]
MDHVIALPRHVAAGLLARTPAKVLAPLADRILASAGPDGLVIVRPPRVGTIVVQVREPLAGDRFILADAVATSCEVHLDQARGWGIRLGEDPRGALAQAVCEAELTRQGDLEAEIAHLLDDRRDELTRARAAEWERLRPTIVQFEEVL